MATDPLARLKQAAQRRERASREYREALLEAHAAGHGYAELAQVLGLSRQAVRQLLTYQEGR